MSRRAGTVVLTSVERADATVTVPQVAIAVQSRAILSAQNGNCRMRHDLPRFIAMMEDGWSTPSRSSRSRYPLDAINDALHGLGREARPERRDRPEWLTRLEQHPSARTVRAPLGARRRRRDIV